jgi:hypothetical protein
METTKTALAALAILGANWAIAANAQSNASAPPPVTTAVTVVAQREAVVTVVAPREAASGQPTGKRQHEPVRVQKAVDADGDGLADAPAPAERQGKTGKTSGKRTAEMPATAAQSGEDCDDTNKRAAPDAACVKSNPLYKDDPKQGQNALHGN